MDFDAAWERSFGELNRSIREDNYEQFRSLLEQNVSVNSPDNRGYLPIHFCASTANPAQYLVELVKFGNCCYLTVLSSIWCGLFLKGKTSYSPFSRHGQREQSDL